MNLQNPDLIQNLQQELMRQAQRAYPRECAGLVVRSRLGEVSTLPCPEQYTSPSGFELPAQLFWLVRKREQTIVAFYHSHPSGHHELSGQDLSSMFSGQHVAWPGVDWYIVPVTQQRAETPIRYRWCEKQHSFVQFGVN